MRWEARLRLLRPRQWVKNAFVLAPLVFASAFSRPEAIAQALAALGLFCLAASAVYVLNDLVDIEGDRQHPLKRESRPLAAGELTPREAWRWLCGLGGALAFGLALAPWAAPGIAAYVLLHAAYSLKLKAVPGLEMACIAAGFVLRVWVGAAAIQVPLSAWMAGTTFVLALHLAVLKRYQELAEVGPAGRPVLAWYPVRQLGWWGAATGAAALVGYAVFCLTARPALAPTLLPVIVGLLRYGYLVRAGRGGETPAEAALADGVLALAIVAWAGVSLYVLWP